MKKDLQDELAARLFSHIDDRTTDRADAETFVHEHEYADPARVALERDKVIATQPTLMAASGELDGPGAFLTTVVNGTGVLLVRQDNEEVRAFRNVCRHRCMTVVTQPAGVSRTFSCGYHGWTYNLDGSLLTIPDGVASFGNVDYAAHGLVELPVAERHGMIWGRTTPGVKLDVADYLGSRVDEELSSLKLDTYTFFKSETFEQPVNWKLVMDGFLEVYHVRYLHPQTVGKITLSNIFLVDQLGNHLRMASARRDIEQLRPVDGVQPSILPGIILTYALMPNTVVVYVRDHVEAWTIVPHESDPARCRITLVFLIPDVPATPASDAYWQRNWDAVVTAVRDEDWAAARSIQPNLKSDSSAAMVLGRNELGLHYFHSYLRTAVGS